MLKALTAPMVDHSYKSGNRESNLWPYQTCDVRIVHYPVYDNGLAGRARARALGSCGQWPNDPTRPS